MSIYLDDMNEEKAIWILNNYKKWLKVDGESGIENHCAEQMTLYDLVSSVESYFNFLLDKKRGELARIRAEIEDDIRKNPKKYKTDKTTDSAVSAIANISDLVIKAEKEHLNYKYIANRAKNARESMQQRKSMLTELAQMNMTIFHGEIRTKPIYTAEFKSSINKIKNQKRKKKKRKEEK